MESEQNNPSGSGPWNPDRVPTNADPYQSFGSEPDFQREVEFYVYPGGRPEPATDADERRRNKIVPFLLTAALLLFVASGISAVYLLQTGNDDADDAKAVAERFIRNAATGNVAAMQADMAAGVGRDELDEFSKTVAEEVGTPYAFNMNSATLGNEGGTTNARLSITVQGARGRAHTDFILRKEGSQFRVVSAGIEKA